MFTIDPKQAAKVAIPDTGQKTLFLDESDSVLKTKDDAGVVEALAVADATEPKVYVALLTQTGTNAPVATVLKNTLGGEVVWSYSDIGMYVGTLEDGFTENKTILYINTNTQVSDWADIDAFTDISLTLFDSDTIRLQSIVLDNAAPAALADTVINNISIKIEVYP